MKKQPEPEVTLFTQKTQNPPILKCETLNAKHNFQMDL